MQKPLTICLVTANRPDTFKQALLSVKNLNYQNFELIVADDSNNDATEIITKEIYPQAPYYRNNPPLREILNSNKAINSAKSDIVCLFHDDDTFESSYFDELLPLMQKDPTIDLAYTGRVMVDEHDKEITKQIILDHEKYCYHSATDILDVMVLGKEYDHYKVEINTPGLVFRKKIFEKMGGFDATITTHCDTDFLLRILAVSDKVLFINKLLYISKIWYGSSGRTKSSETGEVFFTEKAVLDTFIDFTQRKGITKYSRLKSKIYTAFVDRSINLNGPLSWINLRFTGSYSQKLEKYLKTVKGFIQLSPKSVLNPKMYILLLMNILTPKWMVNLTHHILLKLYLKKG